MLSGFLEGNTSYRDSWSIFSRTLFLHDFIDFEAKYLIVVDSEKELIQYSKILENMWIFTSKIDKKASFSSLFSLKKGVFLVEKTVFNLDFNFYEFNKYDNFDLKVDESYDIDDVLKKLSDFHYNYADYQEKWTYWKAWDVLTICPEWVSYYVRVSFWDDIVEEINYIDYKTWEITKVDEFSFGKLEELNFEKTSSFNNDIFNSIKDSGAIIIKNNLDFYEFSKQLIFDNFISFDLFSTPDKEQKSLFINDLNIWNIDILKEKLLEEGVNKVVYTKNTELVNNFLDYNNIDWVEVKRSLANFAESFTFEHPEWKKYVITDDIISKVFIKKRVKKSVWKQMDLMMQINPWDFVVHIDHGVGIYKGNLKKDLLWVIREYLEIEYLWGDKLFVPVTETNRLTKFVWDDNPKLTGLSTKTWQKNMEKASKEAENIAWELLEIYAERKMVKWHQFLPFRREEEAFRDTFKYIHTEDQMNAIDEIYADMEREMPMDRLLSWDVWFWKTEIAFNSIYKAFLNKKQSIFIAPLVVLAYEHYEKAIERFAGMWLTIDVVTRLEKPSKVKATLERLKNWDLDLVVWTHKLLSDSVIFKDLGLMVVDEEHKFWVKDKEKLKSMKANIDILSMSATPIPRSLNMSLSWVKDMSILSTPPFGRKSILTNVSKASDKVIKDAWDREFERGGQLFFVHNRVDNIDSYKTYLESLFPWKKVVITHGQLQWYQLEDRILAFKNKEYDILLTTTVIENGVDFTNANTIIINDAYKFGLAQIHQLRWRVGRNDKQWYCYLLYSRDKIAEDWAKRLKTLVDFSYLGAGFEIAMKDLEIRWGWDILWVKQSGHSKYIWVSAFLDLLEDKVANLKEKSWEQVDKIIKIDTSVDLNISAFIPENFFSSDLDKMNFYREIESITTIDELNEVIAWFKEVNPEFTPETENFFNLLKIKLSSYLYKVSTIKRVWINYQIDFKSWTPLEDVRTFLDLDKRVKFLVTTPERLRAEVKLFDSDLDFVDYMLTIFNHKKPANKIKVRKKL